MNQPPQPNRDLPAEPNNEPLSQETVLALHELGDVLRQIHRRLISEGYIIRDGNIIPPASNELENGNPKA